jgi:MFS family permease
MSSYKYWPMALTLVGFAGSLILSRLLLPSHSLYSLLLALILTSLVGIYAFASADVIKKRQLRERAWRGEPEVPGVPEEVFTPLRNRINQHERVLRTGRRHRVMLLGLLPLGLGSFGCVLAAMYLQVHHPTLAVPVPHLGLTLDASGENGSVGHTHITEWWWPLIGLIPLLYAMISLYEGWKRRKLRVITDHQFIQRDAQSTVLPWTGKEFDPIPVKQIVKIRDGAGMLGGLFGWGWVEIEYRTGTEKDEHLRLKMWLVEEAEDFADDLRSVSPEYAKEDETASEDEEAESVGT